MMNKNAATNLLLGSCLVGFIAAACSPSGDLPDERQIKKAIEREYSGSSIKIKNVRCHQADEVDTKNCSFEAIINDTEWYMMARKFASK